MPGKGERRYPARVDKVAETMIDAKCYERREEKALSTEGKERESTLGSWFFMSNYLLPNIFGSFLMNCILVSDENSGCLVLSHLLLS